MAIVTLAEARDFLPDLPVPMSDTMLSLFIDAVTPVIEEMVGPVEPREVVQVAAGRGTVLLEGRATSATVTRGGLAVTGTVLNAEAGLLTGVWPGDVITYTVGFAVVPAAIRLATLYAVQHAVESQSGAVVLGGGGDEVFVTSRGFFLPNRAKELLEPWRLGARVA